MPMLETVKGLGERLSGIARPGKDEVQGLVQPRKANALRFRDDGVVPNHPSWPLVVYRGAVRLPDGFDPAAVFETLFERHGWGRSWRDGIYDYVHYHSAIHEVLGIARGRAEVRFGGNRGRTLSLKAGDVAVLPAGTGHKCLAHSEDFLVVGAYPEAGSYDECTTSEDHDRALAAIPRVPRPAEDPVYGANGPLAVQWAAHPVRRRRAGR